jgi:type I restriction enzyme S subunit
MDPETAALFPNAFEDSELGKTPKGWATAALAEHLEAVRGLSYKGAGLSDRGRPLHNLNSVLEGGGYKYPGIKYYTRDYKARNIARPGDVIVANTEQGFEYLLIGFPAIVPKRFGEGGLFSHHLYRVRPLSGSPLTAAFTYFLLMTGYVREQVIGCTNGTTVNMLPPSGLQIPRFVTPPATLISRFDELALPMLQRQEANYEENAALAAVRDALLPKLLSGEIRVKDAEKLAEEAL